MTAHAIETLTSTNFDENVEISQREYDQKFNLWNKTLFIDSNPEAMAWAWSVIGVFDDLTSAEEARETFRKTLA